MQPTPVEFTVIESDTLTGLSEAVNARLQQRWFLHGPMMIDRDGETRTYVQPMAKIEIRPIPMGEMDRVTPVSGIIQG